MCASGDCRLLRCRYVWTEPATRLQSEDSLPRWYVDGDLLSLPNRKDLHVVDVQVVAAAASREARVSKEDYGGVGGDRTSANVAGLIYALRRNLGG